MTQVARGDRRGWYSWCKGWQWHRAGAGCEVAGGEEVTEQCRVLAETTVSWPRGQVAQPMRVGGCVTPNLCWGHRWREARYPELRQGIRLQWHQAGGRDATQRWCKVAGTDGTTDVGVMRSWCGGDGGSARGREVTLRGHKVALGGSER